MERVSEILYIPPRLGNVLPSPGTIVSILTPCFESLAMEESYGGDAARSPLYTVTRTRCGEIGMIGICGSTYSGGEAECGS